MHKLFSASKNFLEEKLLFDGTSALGLIERVFSGIAGLITTYLIYLKFTPETQGFYYTFVAILTVKVLLERFSGVGLVSLVAHQWTKNVNQQTKDLFHESSLSHIAVYAAKWYVTAALIVIVAMVVGGSVFFYASKAAVSSLVWFPPWILIAILSGVNIAFTPFWIFLEGCGRVKAVYQFRLVQTIVFNLTMWTFIYLDLGLWALSISGAIDFVIVSCFIYYTHHSFFKVLLFFKIKNQQFPVLEGAMNQFHWKISVGWILGFVFINSFVPVLFFWQGSVVAGRMGMSWSIISALLGLTTSLSMSKAAIFNFYVAKKDWIGLNGLLKRAALTVLGVMVLSVILLLIGYKLFLTYVPEVLYRVLGVGDFVLLLIGASFSALTLPLVIYLRSFKVDPLFYSNLFSSLLGVLAVIYLAKSYSIFGVASIFLCITFFQAAVAFSLWRAKIANMEL